MIFVDTGAWFASVLPSDADHASASKWLSQKKSPDLEVEIDRNGGINASTILGTQKISTGRLRRLQVANEKFSGLPVTVVDNRAGADGRPENGLLPTRLFRSIYFNNTQNFVILNPRLADQR